MPQSHKELSALVFSAIYNRGEFALIETIFHPEYAQKPIGYRGHEGVRRHAEEWRAAFPDLSFELIDQIGEDDGVVNLVLVSGTQSGTLLGHIPPSNRQAAMMAIIVHRFVRGQIVEGVVLMDQLSLLQQLHVLPTPIWKNLAAGGE